MALVDHSICPLHNEGTIFMWYADMKDDTTVYEYDDRHTSSFLDKFRLSYLPWLENATQQYYRRNISCINNMKRIGLLLFDNILCSFKPDLLGTVKNNNFTDIDQSKVKSLGIMGNGGKIFFDTQDGVIHLDGNRDLNVFFFLNNTRVDITNNEDLTYKQLIERHYTSYEFDLCSSNQEITSEGNINAIAIGHKNTIHTSYIIKENNKLVTKNISFEYELIYVLPIRSPNYIILKLNSLDEDIDIELHLTFLANDDFRTIHLEKGQPSSFSIAF